MKWMIASDIHGSATCCRQLLDRFQIEGADRLILMGDLLYHGPRNPLPDGYDPKLVFTMLNGVKDVITAVRGNCDAPVDQWVLDFPIMVDHRLLHLGERAVFLTHGDKWNPDTPPALPRGSILVNGHVHLAAAEDKGEYFYLNPGSPALPHDDFRGYLILTETHAELKTLDGITEKTLAF